MNKIVSKIKEFLGKNESKIALLIGFLLVSALSFEGGALWGQKWQQTPLVIEKRDDTPQDAKMANTDITVASKAVAGAEIESTKQLSDSGTCVYVGSKNSTKFYLSTCSWAKQIKPENKVCFLTSAEAIAQGRTESICKK